MTRRSGIWLLCWAFVGVLLVSAAFEPMLFADAKAGDNGDLKLFAGTEAGGTRKKKSLFSTAAKASAAIKAPVAVIDDETLSLYPTAAKCGECHKQIYEEWSSSQHAYSSISPMFHKFEQKFQELTQGTVGTFCVRCHQQVGTQLGEAREAPLWARAARFRARA